MILEPWALLRRIAEEVMAAGEAPVFFASNDEPFLDAGDWGTLIHLLNQDYADLGNLPSDLAAGSASQWLFSRLDAARGLANMAPAISDLGAMTQKRLANALEQEAQAVFDEKNAAVPATLEGKTVIIEFARGGPEGSALPLSPPYGYRYALSLLSDEILDRASILYVWVDPEESRKRNVERALPCLRPSSANRTGRAAFRSATCFRIFPSVWTGWQ